MRLQLHKLSIKDVNNNKNNFKEILSLDDNHIMGILDLMISKGIVNHDYIFSHFLVIFLMCIIFMI